MYLASRHPIEAGRSPVSSCRGCRAPLTGFAQRKKNAAPAFSAADQTAHSAAPLKRQSTGRDVGRVTPNPSPEWLQSVLAPAGGLSLETARATAGDRHTLREPRQIAAQTPAYANRGTHPF